MLSNPKRNAVFGFSARNNILLYDEGSTVAIGGGVSVKRGGDRSPCRLDHVPGRRH